ncbi:MAG: ParA family protein [Pseudomonadota bacterium]
MTSKVLTVFNEKGGSGKTTTACQLAGTLGLRGYDVLVADLDSQQTSATWLAAAGDSQFPATIWPGYRYGSNITSEIEKLTKKYDIIIADCAPSVEQPSTWGTLLVSDVALIPTKLNPPDLAALSAAKRMAKKAQQQAGRDFPVRVVANATRLHMADDKEAMKLLKSDTEFPPIGVTLGDRKAFTRSMLIGATAHSVRHGEEAVKEIEALADSVLKLLGLPLRAKKVGVL